MSGFLLGLALLLTPIGIVWLSYIGRIADARRAHQQALAEHNETVRSFRQYQRDQWQQYPHMDVTMKDYQQHLKQHPKPKTAFQRPPSLEKRYYTVAGVLLGLEIILVILGFKHWPHQPGHGLMWTYTAVVVIGLLWWYWALMESQGILPDYAQDNPRKQLIPPLPDR